MHYLAVILLFLAAHRVTRLVTRDTIFERPDESHRGFLWGPRTWTVEHLERLGPVGWKLAYLIGCDWCAGLWVSGLLTTGLALYSTRVMHQSWWPWPIWVLVALAASTVTGLIAQHEPD